MTTINNKNQKMSKIKVSKKRVSEFGEVYTQHGLVNEILQKIPVKYFVENLNFLEPSCGNGNFLSEILKMKVSFKHSILDSLKTIYGIDIIQDNISNSRKVLFKTSLDLGLHENEWEEAIKIIKKNIKLGNTLKVDLETFFD